MSNVVLINELLDQKSKIYTDTINKGDIFEIFCAEAILKRYALSSDQIEYGIVDGKNDGGIDSVYTFVNRCLINNDTDLKSFKSPVNIEIYIIQSKIDDNFTETAISKLMSSVTQLIRLDADEQLISKQFNSDVCEAFTNFRKISKGLVSQFPTTNVYIRYCANTDSTNEKAEALSKALKVAIEAALSGSICDVKLVNAKELYELARKQSTFTKELPFVKTPIRVSNSYLLLTYIEDYKNFITEGTDIYEPLFEFNVRDYEGATPVNQEMARSLKDDMDVDFWWMNNGITILAEKATAQDSSITLQNPAVVNGLQTSHEIFSYFASGGKDIDKKRSVQIRVLEINEQSRDKVIKATNSQTKIKPSSLRATEALQGKIEHFLFSKEIYYERRRNYWSNKGKSPKKIITMDKMSQVLITLIMERPDMARARPTTIIREDNLYQKLFPDAQNLEVYEVAAKIYFKINEFMRHQKSTTESIYINNLRYYVLLQAAWALNGSRPIHQAALPRLDVTALSEEQLTKIFKNTKVIFEEVGLSDATAKSQKLADAIKAKSLVPANTLQNKSD